MKVLVHSIQKGGQGKTFGTCTLAFDFHARHLKVAVVDLDPQGNASYTLDAHRSGLLASQLFAGDLDVVRAALNAHDGESMFVIEADAALADLEKMNLPDAAAKLRASLALLAEHGFDVCLIDTAPSLGVGMASAALASHYLVSPIELEAYSLQGMKKMVMMVANLRKANPALRFIGMVPNKVDGRKPRHMRHLEELRTAYPQLVIPVSIGLRDSFAEALGARIPVWEIKKTAARVAAQEARAFAEYVLAKMEIAQ